MPLQSILNQAYVNGRYGDSLDYSLPPEIPLSSEGQKEIEQILAEVQASSGG